MTKPVKAWAVVDANGDLLAPSFDERHWIFEEMHESQAAVMCDEGERVVPVTIILEES